MRPRSAPSAPRTFPPFSQAGGAEKDCGRQARPQRGSRADDPHLSRRDPSADFLRLLVSLRWIAVAGQAATIAFVNGAMRVALPLAPLASGVALLLAFNLFATWRARAARASPARELLVHICVDLAVLAWLVAWSGGIENPFASLFLLPIALSTFALPQRWVWAVAGCATLGFAIAVAFGHPLPHVHGVFGDSFDLHKLGMLVNFLVSAAVMLTFFARFVAAWRARELELATLRERFARNEGIVALATHAASVAHELNTPLATLTLLAEEVREQAGDVGVRDELLVMQQLIDQCRDRVRELALPAHAAPGEAQVDLESVVERWQLIRPTVELRRSSRLERRATVDASIGHLLLALLNNAADAGQQVGIAKVELGLDSEGGVLRGRIRDYGVGFERSEPKLPSVLFRTSKPGGMGIGLALSHATVERLGGDLAMESAREGSGVIVTFRLPVNA